MQKIIVLLFLTTFASFSFAQKIIKHSKVFNVKPVVIKNMNSLASKETCNININNNIDENNKTQILSFNGTEFPSQGQIDPQIAVGGNYVLHASNAGVSIYDKQGNLKQASGLNCFTKSTDAFDPKLFFDYTNKFFGFGVWDGYNDAQKKPMRLMFSQTDNPTQAWNIYSIPANDGKDGGSIGYGKKWIIYAYTENLNLILNASDCKKGKPTKIYKFKTALGQPVFNQDNGASYAFDVDMDKRAFVLKRIDEKKAVPFITIVWAAPNESTFTEMPEFSPQAGTDVLVSSGDFHPKNAVIQNNTLWFTHDVKDNDHSAIEWFQLSLEDGSVMQKGLISKEGTNYIHPTIAVNKRGDMAIGFQETNADMYISVRATYRLDADEVGTTRKVINVEEGDSPYNDKSNKEIQQAWGDYSGSVVDGDNGLDFWFSQSIAKDNKVGVRLYRLKM
jgi:hypothetical protein